MATTYDPTLYATDRRTLVFVDAGFVLTVMQAHHQAIDRSRLTIDHPELVRLLRSTAERLLGCPVLRIYWYDAAHPSARVPNLLAAEMARVDGVRVRLGTLQTRPDGRYEQKAVDTLLVRDMIAHAYKQTAQEMVLFSGDNDLVPGVEEAQEQGVRVHLWAIRGDDLPPSVGRRLSELADSRHDLDAVELATVIAAVATSQPRPHVDVEPVPDDAATPQPSSPSELAQLGEEVAAPNAEVDDAVAPGASSARSPSVAEEQDGEVERADDSAAGSLAGPPDHGAAPSPARMRPSISPAELAAAVRAHTPAVYLRTEEDAFSRLYDLDRDAYNAPVSGDDALAVGVAYAERWASAVHPEVLAALRQRHDPGFDGNIPKPIDSDLLYFGGDHGLDTWAQLEKFRLRRGFWRGLLDASTDAATDTPVDATTDAPVEAPG